MRKMITRVDPLYDAGMSEKRLICQPTESIRVCVHSLYRLLGDSAKAHMKRERLSTGLSHSKTIFPSCHVIWGSHYCLSCALLEEIALINERHFIQQMRRGWTTRISRWDNPCGYCHAIAFPMYSEGSGGISISSQDVPSTFLLQSFIFPFIHADLIIQIYLEKME